MGKKKKQKRQKQRYDPFQDDPKVPGAPRPDLNKFKNMFNARKRLNTNPRRKR